VLTGVFTGSRIDDEPSPMRGCGGVIHQLRTLPGSATLRVWSGSARLALAFKAGRLMTRRSTPAPVRTPGTWILVELARC
jgi:hypothetical protein